VFTGETDGTWTLPTLTTKVIMVKNNGSANLIVQRGGSDEIWTSSAVTSITLTPGEAVIFAGVGGYWSVFSQNGVYANLIGGNTLTGEQVIDSLDVTKIRIGGTSGVDRVLMDTDGDNYGEWTVFDIPIPNGDYNHIDVNSGSWSLTTVAKELLRDESAELKNKTINGDSNTISNLTAANFKAGEIEDLDADLQAIGAVTDVGIIARTGSGTAAARTVTGTTGRISVTNGSGASGNPTIDIGAEVALLASPTFTGTPAAPTAAAGTSTTQLATTAFVIAERTNSLTHPA
jgi:hypothetical protein